MTFLSQQAVIDATAMLGGSTNVYGATKIGASCVVEDQCVLGHPMQVTVDQVRATSGPHAGVLDDLYEECTQSGVVVDALCIIRSGSVVYDGVRLGKGVEIGHSCIVREETTIGAYSRLVGHTSVGRQVSIGRGCRIGGLLANNCIVGNYVTTLGHLVHSYHASVSGMREPAPAIRHGATIGRGAVIVGEVAIGEFALVAAGAVVVDDVDAAMIVAGNPARVIKVRPQGEIDAIRARIERGSSL